MGLNNHLVHGLLDLAWLWKSVASSKATQITLLFLKHWLGKVTTLIIYVDDLIITKDVIEEIARL